MKTLDIKTLDTAIANFEKDKIALREFEEKEESEAIKHGHDPFWFERMLGKENINNEPLPF